MGEDAERELIENSLVIDNIASLRLRLARPWNRLVVSCQSIGSGNPKGEKDAVKHE